MDLIDLIPKLLGELICGLVWGAILLIVSVVLLPEALFRRILRKLKPDLVSKTALLSRFRLVFDYLFNQKEVIIDNADQGASAELQEEIAELVKEKRLLEGNLFFMDLLQNLTGMLTFAVSHSGYPLSSTCDILDQSMEYLRYYAKQLKPSETSKNIGERVHNAADRLSYQVSDTARFLQEDSGEECLKVAQTIVKQGTNIFDSFMKDEYQSAKENLHRTNQLLAEKLMTYIGEAV
jgi:hypothetical protein